MKKIDRTGESFVSKPELGGYEFIIIKYNNCTDVLVQFQDEYKAIVHTNYKACQDKQVKNPYHPSVCGVGRLGLMKDGSKPITTYGKGMPTREYILWGGIIARCYGDYEHWNTYKDVTVCERWWVFANFLEDIKYIEGYNYWLNNPNERIALDKDIKGNNSKVYCLENCCFVSQSDNTKEANRRYGRDETKIYGINILTGERTKDFDSIIEASKYFNIDRNNITACINGRRKTCGGYKWFKIES